MATNIKERILNLYRTFSRQQKKIATVILHSSYRILGVSVKRFSEITDVAESTVIRFVKTIGYDTYAEFQLALNDYIEYQTSDQEKTLKGRRSLYNRDILQGVFHSEISNIKKTLSHINPDSFDESISLLENSDSIYLVSDFGSDAVKNIFASNLKRLGKNVHNIRYSSFEETVSELIDIDNKSVLLIFSYSKETESLLTLASTAKNNGTHIILFTHSRISPLIKYSDHAFVIESNSPSFQTSYTATLTLLNAIISYLSISDEKKVLKRFDCIDAVLNETESKKSKRGTR